MNCCLPESIVLCARISIHTRMWEKRSSRENCSLCENGRLWEPRELLFAGAVVPSARIVILCARVASGRTIIFRTRIAVCGSYRRLWEPSFHARESSFYAWELLFAGEAFQAHELLVVWESSFVGAIVQSTRIVIPCVRVSSCRTIILRTRIAV